MGGVYIRAFTGGGVILFVYWKKVMPIYPGFLRNVHKLTIISRSIRLKTVLLNNSNDGMI